MSAALRPLIWLTATCLALHGVLASLAASLLLAAADGQTKPQTEAGPRYQLVELPLRPLSISGSGWVAGITSDRKAAIWSASAGLVRIPLPPEFSFSESVSINSTGDAVGSASTADASRRVAFLFHRGKVVLLPGEQSQANCINEAGVIAGQAKLPGHKAVSPVLWRDGSLVDLKLCCAGTSRRINAQMLVAGDTYDLEGHYHAFLWDAARGPRLIQVPGEEYSSALALNDRGVAVVRVTPSGLFLYSESAIEPIIIPKGEPRSSSQEGAIVGSFGPHPEAQRAFLWDHAHGMQDLNALIPANSGWTLEVASAIDNQGEIVGWGDHGKIGNAGFLLRPLAEQPFIMRAPPFIF
ncbi:MAG: hypothetical protein WB562_06995 [Candidatus Sulfotelmatobacter sp.]